jgi:hypothetical protein
MLPDNLLQDAGSADAPGLVAEADTTLKALESALAAWQLTTLLGGPYDAGGAVVSIQVLAMFVFTHHPLFIHLSLVMLSPPVHRIVMRLVC